MAVIVELVQMRLSHGERSRRMLLLSRCLETPFVLNCSGRGYVGLSICFIAKNAGYILMKYCTVLKIIG
jgi:hypothetical protein